MNTNKKTGLFRFPGGSGSTPTASRKAKTKAPGVLSIALMLVLGGLCSRGTEDAATTVEIGATPAQVVETLGKPQGTFKVGSRMTYYYERGMVDFIEGRVAKATLMTPEESKAKRQAEMNARRQAELERQRLVDAGRQELARALADPSLWKRTPKERMEFWNAFGKRYPYINVSNQLSEATTALIEEGYKQEHDEKAVAASNRIEEIQARLEQLDVDYAASLTHWKRNEIDAEQAKLGEERETLMGASNTVTNGATDAP